MSVGTVTGVFTPFRQWQVVVSGINAPGTTPSIAMQGFPFISYTVSGTFGSTSLQFQGSNDGGTSWENVGSAVTTAGGGSLASATNPSYQLYQAVLTGGSGITLEIALLGSGARD